MVSKRSNILILLRTVIASVACGVLGARLVLSLEDADAGGLCRQRRCQSGACEGCWCIGALGLAEAQLIMPAVILGLVTSQS